MSRLSVMSVVVVLISAFFMSSASAQVSKREQQLITMMKSGDLRELKTAAKNINSMKVTNPQVLDVASEVLLMLYPEAWVDQVDTLAWLARSIGQAGNGRYHSVLSQVVENTTYKKLRKHAKKALRQTGKADGPQYRQGMVRVTKREYQ